jgi:hypothetical protein
MRLSLLKPIRARLQSVFESRWAAPCLIVAIVSLIALFWLYPLGDYKYGEDSITLVHGFGFNGNPLIPYRLIPSNSNPVSGTFSTFYLDLFSVALQEWGISAGITEDSLILLMILTQVGGVLLLLNEIDRLSASESKGRLAAKVATSLAYVMNPFTLSVTWPHISGWTYFYTLVPLWVWTAYRIHESKGKIPTAIWITVVASILLAPGATGAFGIALLYSCAAFLFLDLVNLALRKISIVGLVSKVGLYSLLSGLALGWNNIPLYLIPGQTTELGSSSLQQLFISESQWTSLLNVMRIVGFNWIYNAPSAYPWSGDLPIVALSATVFAACLAWALMETKMHKWRAIIALLSLPILAFSIGANSPTGSLNLALLKLGGPFLILTNPYYFIGQYYVLAVILSLYVVLSVSLPAWLASPAIDNRADRTHSASAANATPWLALRQWARARRRVVFLGGTILIILCLVVTWIPFVGNQVYQPEGSYQDRFILPPALDLLWNHLSVNYSGPFYYALALPTSSIAAAIENFSGQGSFADTSNLLSHYVPYPVIRLNDNPLTAGLEDYLANFSGRGLSGVLSALHIRYVIIDPYADQSSAFMTHAPDGAPINWTLIEGALRSELGPGLAVGPFTLETESNSTAVFSAYSQLTVIQAPTLSDYLTFVADASVATNRSIQQIATAPYFDAKPASGIGVFTPQRFVPPSATVTVPKGELATVISSNGTAYLATNTVENQSTELTITDPVFANLSEVDHPNTTMGLWNGTYTSAGGSTSTLAIHGNFGANTWISISARINSLETNDWYWVTLTGQDIRLTAGFYANVESRLYSMNIDAYALGSGSPYAWTSDLLRPLGTGSNESLNVLLRPTAVDAYLSENNSLTATPGTLNYSLSGFTTGGQGFNRSLAPATLPFDENYSASLTSVDMNASVSNFALLENSVSWIGLSSQNHGIDQLPCALSINADGTVVMHITPDTTPTPVYVVQAIPAETLWTAQTQYGYLPRLSSGNFSNVFLILPTQSASTTTINLDFHVGINTGLDLSMVVLPLAVLGWGWGALSFSARVRFIARLRNVWQKVSSWAR